MKNFRRLLIASLLVSLGCTDDPTLAPPPTPEDPDPVNVENPDDPRPDPVLPVSPVFPKFVMVNMEPGRSVYGVGNALIPNARLIDEEGNDVAGATFTVEVSPAGAARLNANNRWELLREGTVRFLVCAEARNREGEAICGEDSLLVDNAPPKITITRPLPGAQLDAAMNPTIEVLGTVAESHGVPIVFVNGEEVPVQGGTFAARVAPRFGINHIEVAATDQINPNTSVLGVDVLWAARYAPGMTDRPGMELDQGLAFWLGQNFIDDRRAPARLQDGTQTTDDLADILSLLLLNVDLSSQIPNPVINTASFTLSIPSIDIGKPVVVADIVNGGIEIFMQLTDVEIQTAGGLEIEGQVLNLNGRIYATMSALVRMDITKASASAPLEVEVSNITLAVESARSDFTSAEANAIFTLAQSVLRTTLEDVLVDTVNDTFVSELPALIEDTLGSLDTAFRDQTFDLDLGFGTPISLHFDAGISSITSRFRHSVYAPMFVTMNVDAPRNHTTSRGIPLMVTTPSDPFFQSSRVQLGIRLGLFNGLLHSLWDGGLLELDVTQQLPVQVDQAMLSAKLQPVIRPPLEGQPATFVLQLGQVELALSLLGRNDVYGLNLEADLYFDIVDDQIKLSFSATPTITAWVISSDNERPLLTPQGLKDLFLQQVYPQLLTAIGTGLSFPIPTPDLSGLGSVAPPLGTFSIAFELYRRIEVRNEWIVLDAALTGRL